MREINCVTFFQEIYHEQMELFNKNGYMTVYKFLPDLAGGFQWTNQLKQRISISLTSVRPLEHTFVCL